MRKAKDWSFEKDNNSSNNNKTKLVIPNKTDLRKKERKHKLLISATDIC